MFFISDVCFPFCVFRRLQAATATCHSSDEDSTDSGEELDSPLKIVQQPTEGMDTSESKSISPFLTFFMYIKDISKVNATSISI